MGALIIAVLFLGAAVFSILPIEGLLNWGPDVLVFFRGALPVLAFLVGIVALIIAISDIRDRVLSKKEKSSADDGSEQ